MPGKRATDSEIAALAGVQHGVASRVQLIQMGLTRNEVERRVTIGRLHPIHRGVYAVGHRVVTREGRRMAATLATGGVLSHITAATAWGFAKHNGAIHVTVPGDPGQSRRTGVRVHRSRTLTSDDTTTHARIPRQPGRTPHRLRAPPTHRATSLQAVLRAYTSAETRSHLCAPTVFESDRERDVILTTRGWRVLRFTWRQVTTRPEWVAEAIRLAWRPG